MKVAATESRVGHRMSGAEFRAFQARRPDYERWELLAGIPMMIPPPTIAHNCIAGNLDRLLNLFLDRHNPSWLSMQRLGLELGGGEYKPEPDVGVIDAESTPGSGLSKRRICWPRWHRTPMR